MKVGSEGDQVKLLQTLLALDTAIYPEALVTGYFGPATRRAIERFQRRHGLETVGFVGPRTRAELNKLIREQFKIVKNLEEDVEDDIKDDIRVKSRLYYKILLTSDIHSATRYPYFPMRACSRDMYLIL